MKSALERVSEEATPGKIVAHTTASSTPSSSVLLSSSPPERKLATSREGLHFLSPSDESTLRSKQFHISSLHADGPGQQINVQPPQLPQSVDDVTSPRQQEDALREVCQEVRLQNTRYEALLSLNHDITRENEVLREQFAFALQEKDRAIAQCHVQSEAVKHMRSEILDLQQSLRAAEEATAEQSSKGHDAAHLQASIQQLTVERSDLLVQLTAQQSQMDILNERLENTTTELAEKQGSLQQFEAEAAAVKRRIEEVSGCIPAMEALLSEREAAIASLEEKLQESSRKLRESAKQSMQSVTDVKQTGDKVAEELTAQIEDLRDRLDVQTDEVRKKSHRVTLLEKEKRNLRAELEEWRRFPSAVQEQQLTLHRSVLVLSRECHAHWKTLSSSAVMERGAEDDEALHPSHAKDEERDNPTSLPMALRGIAHSNAAIIRAAQLLGRRSRVLFSLCRSKLEEAEQGRQSERGEAEKAARTRDEVCHFLKGKLAEEAERCRHKEAQLSDAWRRTEALEKTLRAREEVQEAEKAHAAKLSAELLEAQGMIAKYSTELARLETQVSEGEETHRLLLEECRRQRVEVLSISSQCTSLQAEYEAKMEEPIKQLSRLEKSLSEAVSAKKDLEDRVNTANTQVKELTAKLSHSRPNAVLKQRSERPSAASGASEGKAVTDLKEKLQAMQNSLKSAEEEHKRAAIKHKDEAAHLRLTLKEAQDALSLEVDKSAALGRMQEVQSSALRSLIFSLHQIFASWDGAGREEVDGASKPQQILHFDDDKEDLQLLLRDIVKRAHRLVLDFTSATAKLAATAWHQGEGGLASRAPSHSALTADSPEDEDLAQSEKRRERAQLSLSKASQASSSAFGLFTDDLPSAREVRSTPVSPFKENSEQLRCASPAPLNTNASQSILTPGRRVFLRTVSINTPSAVVLKNKNSLSLAEQQRAGSGEVDGHGAASRPPVLH